MKVFTLMTMLFLGSAVYASGPEQNYQKHLVNQTATAKELKATFDRFEDRFRENYKQPYNDRNDRDRFLRTETHMQR